MTRALIISLYLIVVLSLGTVAQDRKFDPEIKAIPDSVLLKSKYRTGIEVGTSFMTNLKKGYGFETYFSPNLSYYPSKSLKFDFNATLSTVNYHNLTLFDYYNSTHIVSGIGHYFGVSGEGTYKVNDRVFLTSVGFAEKLPDLEPVGNKYENRFNYGGAFLVGYKVSDKVSIQAGIGIQRIYNPLDVSTPMYNHGFLP